MQNTNAPIAFLFLNALLEPRHLSEDLCSVGCCCSFPSLVSSGPWRNALFCQCCWRPLGSMWKSGVFCWFAFRRTEFVLHGSLVPSCLLGAYSRGQEGGLKSVLCSIAAARGGKEQLRTKLLHLPCPPSDDSDLLLLISIQSTWNLVGHAKGWILSAFSGSTLSCLSLSSSQGSWAS